MAKEGGGGEGSRWTVTEDGETKEGRDKKKRGGGKYIDNISFLMAGGEKKRKKKRYRGPRLSSTIGGGRGKKKKKKKGPSVQMRCGVSLERGEKGGTGGGVGEGKAALYLLVYQYTDHHRARKGKTEGNLLTSWVKRGAGEKEGDEIVFFQSGGDIQRKKRGGKGGCRLEKKGREEGLCHWGKKKENAVSSHILRRQKGGQKGEKNGGGGEVGTLS